MKFNRVYAIFLRYMYLVRGNPTRFSSMFVWAALDIVLWGFISRYLNSLGATGFSFTATLLGAVVLWAFLMRVQQGIVMPFFEDVWSRNFLNFFGSPLSRYEYLLGLILTGVVSSSIGFAIILLLTYVLFGLSAMYLGVMLVPFVLILLLFGLSLGVMSATLVLRFGPAAEWMVWPIPMLIQPFCAVFYPVSVLPAWMQTIAFFMPPSHVFEGMRAVLMHETFPLSSLMIGFISGVVYLFLAYLLFSYVYSLAIRTGLIARYSAEST